MRRGRLRATVKTDSSARVHRTRGTTEVRRIRRTRLDVPRGLWPAPHATAVREFGHGTIVQYSRHCPMPHSPNAARCTSPYAAFAERGPRHNPAARAAAACSPDRQVRVRRGSVRPSSAGATGKELTFGGPMFGPNSGLCRTAMGDSHILPRVIGSVACPWLCLVSAAAARLCPALYFPPPGPRGPGYTPRPPPRPDYGIERSDPPIPWIVRFQWAASGGRGLRPNPKRLRAAALQGAGRAGRLVGFQRPLRGQPERRHLCALQTRHPGAYDRPPPPRFCFPRILPTEFVRHASPPGGRRRY